MYNKSKFNIDLLYNLISFGFIASVGLLINLIIIHFKGYDELGIFNQVYAIYLLLSQLSVFGIHLAVQKFIPEQTQESIKESIIGNAIISIILINIILTGIYYISNYYTPFFPLGTEVQENLYLVFPALFFFSLNKVLLQYLNGKREMKIYAIMNSLRFLLMIIILFILLYYNLNISLIFLITECILCLSLFVITYKNIQFTYQKEMTLKLLSFSKNIFMGNLFLDINSRVDIIVLGIFLSNEFVGVYSFVVIFYEGMNQILVVIRNNVNPIITKLYYHKSKAQLIRFVKSTKKRTYKRYSLLVLISLLLFPVLLIVINEQQYFYEMCILYALLSVANLISSGYNPFYNYFSQVGLPKTQSYLYIGFFTVNLLVDLLLIPYIGLYGAAIGIIISNIFVMIYINRKIKITINNEG